MVISSQDKPLIKEAIDREGEAYLEYKEMAEKSPKNNIRWFLSSFSEARRTLRDRLLNILEEGNEKNINNEGDSILHIQATEHLDFSGDVDKNSLQSVLLYISKKESEDLDYFRSIVEKCRDESVCGALKQILQEKETVHIKADRLYHDMIETY